MLKRSLGRGRESTPFAQVGTGLTNGQVKSEHTLDVARRSHTSRQLKMCMSISFGSRSKFASGKQVLLFHGFTDIGPVARCVIVALITSIIELFSGLFKCMPTGIAGTIGPRQASLVGFEPERYSSLPLRSTKGFPSAPMEISAPESLFLFGKPAGARKRGLSIWMCLLSGPAGIAIP